MSIKWLGDRDEADEAWARGVEDPDRLDRARNDLFLSLKFSRTPQGGAYWQGVMDNLCAMLSADQRVRAKVAARHAREKSFYIPGWDLQEK